jgi:hypothetical protein
MYPTDLQLIGNYTPALRECTILFFYYFFTLDNFCLLSNKPNRINHLGIRYKIPNRINNLGMILIPE